MHPLPGICSSCLSLLGELAGFLPNSNLPLLGFPLLHKKFPYEADGGCPQTCVALTHLALSQCALVTAALKLHKSAIAL